MGGMHPFVYGLGKPFMARLNLKANKAVKPLDCPLGPREVCPMAEIVFALP